MDNRKIILNSIQCNHCKDILISHSRHMYVTCKCGACTADGGRAYTKRIFKKADDYTELSVYDDPDYEVIRHSIYRGTYGKAGDQPLKWVKLSEMDDQHLFHLISWCERDAYPKPEDYKYYVQEEQYRNLNNIHIEE